MRILPSLSDPDDVPDDDPDDPASLEASLESDTISDNLSDWSRPRFCGPPVGASRGRFLDGDIIGNSFGSNVGGGAPPNIAPISGPRMGLRMPVGVGRWTASDALPTGPRGLSPPWVAWAGWGGVC